jgi:4-hydroxy-3-methylbut-2-enyl diphosphate reductase
MRILLANPRGFCAGVNMAIDVVEQVLRLRGAPVYVYHEIVHNRHVVDDFRARGVVFVDGIEEVPDGSVVVFSAHGISPAIRFEAKRRQLVEVDATCPLVIKVHHEVQRFAKEGYSILFIGHAQHDEAVGTVGEAPDAITVVESVEDVDRLVIKNPNKIAYVTQTTLSLYDAQRIIDALKIRFPNIKAPPKEDICYATTNRQNAVAEVAPEVDLVLVVGSRNSSNSQRLVETAHQAGKAAYLIDDQSELNPQWFEGVGTVLITAGASAPEHLVQDLVTRIQREHGADSQVRTVAEEDMWFAPPKSLRSLTVVG